MLRVTNLNHVSRHLYCETEKLSSVVHQKILRKIDRSKELEMGKDCGLIVCELSNFQHLQP